MNSSRECNGAERSFGGPKHRSRCDGGGESYPRKISRVRSFRRDVALKLADLATTANEECVADGIGLQVSIVVGVLAKAELRPDREGAHAANLLQVGLCEHAMAAFAGARRGNEKSRPTESVSIDRL